MPNGTGPLAGVSANLSILLLDELVLLFKARILPLYKVEVLHDVASRVFKFKNTRVIFVPQRPQSLQWLLGLIVCQLLSVQW